jgi:hypothetical protein
MGNGEKRSGRERVLLRKTGNLRTKTVIVVYLMEVLPDFT